jgi:hypothetical protein
VGAAARAGATGALDAYFAIPKMTIDYQFSSLKEKHLFALIIAKVAAAI